MDMFQCATVPDAEPEDSSQTKISEDDNQIITSSSSDESCASILADGTVREIPNETEIVDDGDENESNPGTEVYRNADLDRVEPRSIFIITPDGTSMVSNVMEEGGRLEDVAREQCTDDSGIYEFSRDDMYLNILLDGSVCEIPVVIDVDDKKNIDECSLEDENKLDTTFIEGDEPFFGGLSLISSNDDTEGKLDEERNEGVEIVAPMDAIMIMPGDRQYDSMSVTGRFDEGTDKRRKMSALRKKCVITVLIYFIIFVMVVILVLMLNRPEGTTPIEDVKLFSPVITVVPELSESTVPSSTPTPDPTPKQTSSPTISTSTPLSSSSITPPTATPISNCKSEEKQLSLKINTNYGKETTWNIMDSQSVMIASGGPYGNNANYEEIACLVDGCYSLTMKDDDRLGVYVVEWDSQVLKEGQFQKIYFGCDGDL